MKKKLLSRKQYDKFMKTLPVGYCTFCNWKDYQIVLHEGYQWIWIANFAPYWKYHTMLVPKRHFEEFGEMTNSEAVEFKQLLKLAMDRYESKTLYGENGDEIKNYVYFWRRRGNHFDSISGTQRPSHFHVHFVPDKEHLWDPIVSNKAHEWNIKELVK